MTTRLLTNHQEFWRRVDVLEVRDCWRWMGTQQGPYGTFSTVDDGQISAHRYAWSFAYGPIPAGALVLHSCDNRWCVNPRHLRLGTHDDNMLDRTVLSRVREALAEADVSEQELTESIGRPVTRETLTTLLGFGAAVYRLRRAAGLTQRQLAEKLGVSGPLISQWESGTCGANLSRLTAIAAALGVEVTALVAPEGAG